VFLHRLISISGIVDVDPDGKTAKGRWFAIGFHAGHVAGEAGGKLGSGTFENEYVKEDGNGRSKGCSIMLFFILHFQVVGNINPISPNPDHLVLPVTHLEKYFLTTTKILLREDEVVKCKFRRM